MGIHLVVAFQFELIFRTYLLRYLSLWPICLHLAAHSKIAKTWRSNSQIGYAVLGKWSWISFLSNSWIGFSVLASPLCISDNAYLIFQFVQFGTGLSTGFTQWHLSSSICTVIIPVSFWSNQQLVKERLYFSSIFSRESFPFNGFILVSRTFLNSKEQTVSPPYWFFLELLTDWPDSFSTEW